MVSHRIVYEPFTPPWQYTPGLPEGVVHVLERALEKDPEARFTTAGQLARDLRDAVAIATGSETRIGQRPTLPPPPPLPGGAAAGTTAGAAAAAGLPMPAGTAAAPMDDGGTATQDVTPMLAVRPPVVAPPGARGGLPGVGRIAAIVAAAAGVGLLITAAAFGWLNWGQPEPPRPVAEAPAGQAQYLPLMLEARRELEAGRPEQALVAITRAMAVAPTDPAVLRLQERVRAAVLERQSAAQQAAQREEMLTAGEAAMAAGQPAQAADLARQVLTLTPGEPRATTLLAAADKALDERRRRDAARAQARTAPQPAPTGQAAAAAPQAAVPQGPATLNIDFFTEAPEGVFTIYSGAERILSERFSFFERSGLRRQPRAGRIEASRQLPSGPVTLRIYVAPPRRSPVVRTLQVQVQGGHTHQLQVRFDAAGELSVGFE
jgi:hypothetical protein